jgi:FemAB-related protein (PEP-CTERM system-associated)
VTTTATVIRADARVSRATDAYVASTWRRAVDDLAEARLAHAPEWHAVIRSTYQHEPLYLEAEDGDGGWGILPAFIVRRPVGGAVVSSMPYLDGGGPCGSSAALADALVAHLIEEARSVGADAVELRCPWRLAVASEPMEHKVSLTLSLPGDPGRLWQQLDGSVRNQIRKAERSGLSVEIGGAEKLDEFYPIFATRMHELGSPVHARRFFGDVFQAFGAQARLALVRKGATPIGGLIALGFKDVFTVPWASCLRPYLTLCPNMLLYWEAIRTGCGQGFRRFDFGRSTRDSGTYRFKRQWGAGEEPLFWYTIPTDRRRLRSRPSAARPAAFLAESWRHLPLAVTRRLGPHIRKYLTQ